MADVRPFYGIRYNVNKIKDLAQVVTPPYDVIDADGQRAYHEKHACNIIRLDKGLALDTDGEHDNPYTRAASFFSQWLEDEILIQDDVPGFYVTTVSFEHDGKTMTRTGIIGIVRLQPFSDSIILPHEQTFSKVKSERFKLISTCRANFSPVFSIFSDKSGILPLLQSQCISSEPLISVTDDAGHLHKVWRITDHEVCSRISMALADRRLFIADGHHRYETALAYRDWLREHGEIGNEHPANFIMMYMSAVEDPGLLILPVHRLLADPPHGVPEDLEKKAASFFAIEKIEISVDFTAARYAFEKRLRELKNKHAFGLYVSGMDSFLILLPLPHCTYRLRKIPAPLRELDVTYLTYLFLMDTLGYTPETLDDEGAIKYVSSLDTAVKAVDSGMAPIACILNPVTNEQVRKVAASGRTMPRKSTYYHPKALSGLVIYSHDRQPQT